MSGVRRLENGNTLIVPATENKIFEINSEEKLFGSIYITSLVIIQFQKHLNIL